MGWTDKCQKVRYFKHTAAEWEDWISGLPDEGFGRYDREGWWEWLAKMRGLHGAGRSSTSSLSSSAESSSKRARTAGSSGGEAQG